MTANRHFASAWQPHKWTDLCLLRLHSLQIFRIGRRIAWHAPCHLCTVVWNGPAIPHKDTYPILLGSSGRSTRISVFIIIIILTLALNKETISTSVHTVTHSLIHSPYSLSHLHTLPSHTLPTYLVQLSGIHSVLIHLHLFLSASFYCFSVCSSSVPPQCMLSGSSSYGLFSIPSVLLCILSRCPFTYSRILITHSSSFSTSFLIHYSVL